MSPDPLSHIRTIHERFRCVGPVLEGIDYDTDPIHCAARDMWLAIVADLKTRPSDIKESLAALEHEQWAHWTRHMLDHLTPENVERWWRQIETPYADLSEKEKASDREWAMRVLEML